jgi:hypothetical protein
MKIGYKTLVLALVVALLCVPAGFAKNGNGHGKPSWAGSGGDGQGHAKPAWAGVGKGKGHAKHEKVEQEKANHQKVKHQKAGADDAAADEINLDDLNPAWYCFTLEAMMDAAEADAVAGGAEAGEFSSFDAEFGTNDNKRNSHGQCVSRRAQGADLSGSLDDQEQSCDAADQNADENAGDDTVGEETESDDTGAGTDDPAADEGSQDQADESGDCQGGDSADEDSQDEADDSGTDEEQADQGAGTETAAFARVLVRFIKL